MNFIKKKLKGHKKDDEEEEYEKAVYEQSLHPENQDQKMKNTEEWQFFQQLSMKVQDTVQKTQTTLNKLKDIRQDGVEEDEKDHYDLDSGLTKDPAPYGRVLRAPPRPPPPSGDKTAPVDMDFGSDFSQSSPSKGPPRPPPPGSSESSFVDSSALHETPSKSFGSPARPPPPNVGKPEPASENFAVSDSVAPGVHHTEKDVSFSLLDEFGFQSNTVTSSANTNMQDLLFLDDKEEVDPFDTSFVDVDNISSTISTSEKQDSGTKNKASENSFNPFSSSTVSETWVENSADNSDANKKSSTNPFFSGLLSDKVDTEQKNSASSHNPFSFGDPVSLSNAQSDLFGLNLIPSPSNNNIPEDIFQTAETSVPENLFQKTETSKSSLEENKNSSILNIYSAEETFKGVDNSENEILPAQDILSSTISQKNITGDVNDVWRADKDEVNVFASEIVLNPEIAPTAEKDSNASSLWDSASLETNILVPEKLDVKTESTVVTNEEEKSTEEIDFFDNSNVPSLEQTSTTDVAFSVETKSDNSVLQQTTSSNIVSNLPSPKDEKVSALSSDAFDSSSTLKEDSNQLTSEASNGFDFKLTEGKESELKEKIDTAAAFGAEQFSKPFEEENEQNAFVFKIKSGNEKADLEFDAFAAKFESAKEVQGNDAFDPFLSKKAPTLKKIQDEGKGFDSMDEFDPFRVTKVEETSRALKKEPSRDSFEDYDNEVDFSVIIKPKVKDSSDVKLSTMEPPKLLPPPKTPTKAFETGVSRFNPFDKDFLDSGETARTTDKTHECVDVEDEPIPALGEAGVRKADSIETPLSPLFDEDTSQPLEVFPKPFDREGWDMVLRQPNKKKLTGNRFWKKIFVKLSENSVLQLFNKSDDKLPFQELPLQACYSLSEIGAQQYDQYGKIFTVKLQYKFYRERVGVRPGQISKVAQGQVTSMGDVAKLGLPLQHSPQTSQLLKLGSQSYSDMKFFIQEVEDALFRMVVHRDRVLTYKTEEVQVIAQDEFYVEQSKTGHIDKQLARVRIFFLAFITGMPSVEVGLNDINRQGKEVVGRYDIIPVVTEEWIRLEDCEFHSCVIQDEFHKNRVIKFHPPDACLFELLRFRIRPPKNRELPLQVRVFMTVSNTRVEIRSDILVPGYSSRKQGQVPCENIQIRFPVPECWIYLFRTEKHFRYGSKKSAARRPGKIKGLERIIGAAQNLDTSLIEVSAGQAKYEHVFHAVVWRIPRLPKEGQGAYTQQLFLLRTELTSFDQIPESFEQYVDVEFTMPATYVSHTTVRSVSVTNPIPPEKYVRYISKHEYKVEIDFKNSSDEIDGLMTPNVNVPVTTTPVVQESTEDEEKDDDSD
ncbi:Protein stoned-B, partial [Stegodyphus mimosarum]